MRDIDHVEFKSGNREERLPGYAADFPYIASRVDTGRLAGAQSPWHWHREAELFYVKKGTLRYVTPGGSFTFAAGSGGLVNSNVLHMARQLGEENCVSLIHIFDPVLIDGGHHTRIGQKFVVPLISAGDTELVELNREVEAHRPVLEALERSFCLDEAGFDYEVQLRNALSSIWCEVFYLCRAQGQAGRGGKGRSDEKAKLMIAYIHEHLEEKLTTAAIAASAYISERECFRVFGSLLHTTPLAYLTDCRLERACDMLAYGDEPVTEIGYLCGLGSSSYFGKTFRRRFGCTPTEYRGRWQDRDNSGRNPDRSRAREGL